MNLSNFSKYGLTPKQLVDNLQYVSNEEELKQFAEMYNIDDINDLEVLRQAWTFLKTKVFQPTVAGIKKAFEPVGEAIKGRTQYEIEMAGRRLAQQIYPQGQFLPQPQPQPQPQVVQTGFQPSFDLMRYLPFIMLAVIAVALIKSKKK